MIFQQGYRILTFILFVLCCTGGYAAIPNEVNKNLQSIISDFRENSGASAASLAISFSTEQAPRTYYSGTIKNEGVNSIHIGNLFQTGSITKSFIASIMLRLQDKGILSLDDKLSKWLPKYTKWKNIKLRQLLNHTSGIYNFTDSSDFRAYLFANPEVKIDADKLISYALNEALYFNPGQGWHYSNTGYILLGQVIEKATSTKFENILQKLILNNDKFNLNNTFFVSHGYPQNIEKRMIHGYYFLSPGQAIDITPISMSWLNAAGGVVINVYDLTKWVRLLFEGHVMSENSFAQFTTLVSTRTGQLVDGPTLNDPETYGLGIQSYKTPFDGIGNIWWHSGGTLGYKTLMMWLPTKKIAIAIAYNKVEAGHENASFSPETELAKNILQLISKEF